MRRGARRCGKGVRGDVGRGARGSATRRSCTHGVAHSSSSVTSGAAPSAPPCTITRCVARRGGQSAGNESNGGGSSSAVAQASPSSSHAEPRPRPTATMRRHGARSTPSHSPRRCETTCWPCMPWNPFSCALSRSCSCNARRSTCDRCSVAHRAACAAALSRRCSLALAASVWAIGTRSTRLQPSAYSAVA